VAGMVSHEDSIRIAGTNPGGRDSLNRVTRKIGTGVVSRGQQLWNGNAPMHMAQKPWGTARHGGKGSGVSKPVESEGDVGNVKKGESDPVGGLILNEGEGVTKLSSKVPGESMHNAYHGNEARKEKKDTRGKKVTSTSKAEGVGRRTGGDGVWRGREAGGETKPPLDGMGAGGKRSGPMRGSQSSPQKRRGTKSSLKR